jgi:DNA-binding response OmpR family regulator
MFLESNIEYSLLLFDAELSDMTGLDLARFTREQEQRVSTPLIVLSTGEPRCEVAGVSFVDVGSVVETITATLRHSET